MGNYAGGNMFDLANGGGAGGNMAPSGPRQGSDGQPMPENGWVRRSKGKKPTKDTFINQPPPPPNLGLPPDLGIPMPPMTPEMPPPAAGQPFRRDVPGARMLPPADSDIMPVDGMVRPRAMRMPSARPSMGMRFGGGGMGGGGRLF